MWVSSKMRYQCWPILVFWLSLDLGLGLVLRIRLDPCQDPIISRSRPRLDPRKIGLSRLAPRHGFRALGPFLQGLGLRFKVYVRVGQKGMQFPNSFLSF